MNKTNIDTPPNMTETLADQPAPPVREKMPPLSEARLQISGARALANLLLLEHDFRRAQQQIPLARLMVEQLRNFTNYECAVFWLASPYGRVKQLVISGVDDAPDSKLMQQWGRGAAKWLTKALSVSLKKAPKKVQDKAPLKADLETDSETDSDSATHPQPESAAHHIIINADTMPDKVFNIWPETVPMNGLCVPIKTPSGKLMGGLLLLREEAWGLPVRILLDQMAEAVGYSLCAIDLGIYGKRGLARRFMRGLFFILVAFLLVGVGFVLADFI